MYLRMPMQSSYFESVISPTPKLEVTMLVIKREPRDVNLAGALKYTRRDVQHRSIRWGNDVGLESSVESFIRTTRRPRLERRNNVPDVLTCCREGCPVSRAGGGVPPRCPRRCTPSCSNWADSQSTSSWTTCRSSAAGSFHPFINIISFI